jgi:poly(glycerol-phosphate) alpha-glucosyltransferase
VLKGTRELQTRFLPSISVYGLTDDYYENDRNAWGSLPVTVFEARGFKAFGYSPALIPALLSANLDVLHVHCLWVYPSVAAPKWATITGKPYIISVHGMLDPWALKHSAWKKTVAGMLYEHRHLKGASCLHAVSSSEVDSIRRFGLTNPVCLIPYGIDSQDANACRRAQDTRELLFLGRIHPKKGLVNLLDAWRHVQRSLETPNVRWRLVIAGWDQMNHQAELIRISRKLGVSSSVEFVGPKFGSDKDALLGSAHAFILPSFSEGLPLSILEAWAYGLPVVMTPECNIPQGFAAGAAVRIGTATSDIVPGLMELMAMSDDELSVMGSRGRQLVEKDFSWATYAEHMYSVYSWVAGKGPKPDCVSLA